jgi:hypothetical protein
MQRSLRVRDKKVNAKGVNGSAGSLQVEEILEVGERRVGVRS